MQNSRFLQNSAYGSDIYQRAEWWWNEKGRKAPRDCSCGNKIHHDIEKSIVNMKTKHCVPKTLSLSQYFILIFLSILAYQEKLGNEKEPCINHDSCKIGHHCGKSNCVKIINYQKISFDCCEKCKKLRNFSIL